MKKSLKRILGKEEGFTIIEVVLVLAIAGLIFLVVFLALPQLQRSRRDTQRKSDVGRVVAGLESYSGNNNGTYPVADDVVLEEFVVGYIETGGSDFNDPSGYEYDLLTNGGLAIDPDATPDGEMYYNLGYTCSTSEGQFDSGNPRDVAVAIPLESGIAFCQDNQ